MSAPSFERHKDPLTPCPVRAKLGLRGPHELGPFIPNRRHCDAASACPFGAISGARWPARPWHSQWLKPGLLKHYHAEDIFRARCGPINRLITGSVFRRTGCARLPDVTSASRFQGSTNRQAKSLMVGTTSAIEDTGKQSYLAERQPEMKMKRRIWLGLLGTFGLLFVSAAQAATVVALGASNTFGKGVSRSQAYPAPT